MSTNTRSPTPTRKASNSTPRLGRPKNGTILNFFKKADETEASAQSSADPLFIDSADYGTETDSPNDSGFAEDLYGIQGHQGEGCERFNELEVSNKKRRISASPSERKDAEAQRRPDAAGVGQRTCSPPPPDLLDETNRPEGKDAATEDEKKIARTKDRVGPFVDESDSEDEKKPTHDEEDDSVIYQDMKGTVQGEVAVKPEPADEDAAGDSKPPELRRQSTSYMGQDGFDDFEGMEDFDDEYEDGDENAERRWQMEQRRLEMQEQGFEGELEDDDFGGPQTKQEDEESLPDMRQAEAPEPAPTCPICSASFEGVSDQEASVHVNHCLDGNPTPLPTKAPTEKPNPPEQTVKKQSPGPNFKRLVRPPKPGQENPFQLGKSNGTSSAFSKLMSGHAEDAAWAGAAAAENASRGKPAYTRTCPFYKILPGFNICVDAFRYGAVEGCRAYFLSHFHSDHYIGLTSTWNHGPIYCSRPTANLVRQQLRVDPRWVIDLEFEKQMEVPGTHGVQVTMIPANHCPGSSLYLFEKVTNPQSNRPKVQRVLHCGDFRACPAHVEHPLLKPEVVDSITGKTAQQKIDVCYLDTTYLNPKYAFPSQEDVIQACADMCVSLNKSKVDKSDNFEQMKASRAGGSMAKFVRQDSKDDTAGPPDPQSPVKPLGDKSRGPLLVIVGTYSIGKERICLGIARALNSLIYAPPGKQRICAALQDDELNARLTRDPRAAQVHMTPLFEIRAETLGDYMAEYSDRFSRAVGFRPSGWNYRPPGSRFTDSPAVGTVLYSDNWKSGYSVKDLIPQRGSNSRTSTFGVPYSEHSSFRELTMFCCALRIDKVIPTVNVGSAKSREKMKVWVDRWDTFRKKEGLFDLKKTVVKEEDEEDTAHSGSIRSEWYPAKGTWELRTTL